MISKKYFYLFWIIIGFSTFTSAFAGRLVIRYLEGDFEQEFRILEDQGVWRVDAPSKNWTILYREATRTYTGMEHRDAFFWSFCWDDVQRAVQGSKSRFQRFGDLDIEGYASYDLTRPTSSHTAVDPWMIQSLNLKGQWNDRETLRWKASQRTQDNYRLETIQDLFLKTILQRFLVIHDQIRHAVVRPLWPQKIDQLILECSKQGMSPVRIEWGEESSEMYWRVKAIDSEGRAEKKDFEIPSKYRPSVLESLKGIVEEKP